MGAVLQRAAPQRGQTVDCLREAQEEAREGEMSRIKVKVRAAED